MPQNIAQIEQTAQVSAELANDYMIGGLAQTAGIPGGGELQDAVAHLMGSLGVELSHAPPEAGQLGLGLMGIRAALGAGAKKGAATLAANPSRWAIALGLATGAVATSAGVYTWMSSDQQIQLEQVRQNAKIQAQLIADMTPEQRHQLAKEYASQTFSAGPGNLVPWLIAGGLLAWWFIYKKKE